MFSIVFYRRHFAISLDTNPNQTPGAYETQKRRPVEKDRKKRRLLATMMIMIMIQTVITEFDKISSERHQGREVKGSEVK